MANRVQFGTPYCHFDDDLMMTENRRFFGFLKYSSIKVAGTASDGGDGPEDTNSQLVEVPLPFWAGSAAVNPYLLS